MIPLERIALALARRSPFSPPVESRTHAAVALILRESERGIDVLFIERAPHDDDPWSGDLGFPGGKVEEDDFDPRRTAQRETFEEVGLDLTTATFLGQLDDIAGVHLPVQISCYVWGTTSETGLVLNHEVSSAFWFPLSKLADPKRHGKFTVRFKGVPYLRPAIRILEPGKTVLWGITYRLVMQFLEILDILPADLPEGERWRGAASADP